MAEVIQGILAEARKNRFCTINPSLSDDDVASVWDNVSAFIEKQMTNQKGVTINGLGTFTFTQKKLDVGNNKFIQIQRPVFQISERFAQSQALQCPKYHVPGQIPVVPLNLAALAFESPFDRDTVESCVKEVLGAITRAVGNRRNVELTFAGIGKLSIRDSKVKMRFYKEFITQMDGSGKLISTMQNRPGTVDSVLSDRPTSRPGSTNTLLLPRLNPTTPSGMSPPNLAPLAEEAEDRGEGEGEAGAMGDCGVGEGRPSDGFEGAQTDVIETLGPFPTDDLNVNYITEPTNGETEPHQVTSGEALYSPVTEDVATAMAISNLLNEDVVPGQKYSLYKPSDEGVLDIDTGDQQVEYTNIETAMDQRQEEVRRSLPASRCGFRTAIPLAQATGISLDDDLFQPQLSKPPSRSACVARISPNPLQISDGLRGRMSKPPTPPKLEPLERSRTEPLLDGMEKHVQFQPPLSACGHSNAGQELCYLCHQRARRNVPVSFAEEIKRREEEDDRLLREYQTMKDAEEALKEQDRMLVRRHDLQKMAAFNLGVSDAIKEKKTTRDTEFHKSYVFQKRPLTPPRFFKQDEYSKDLAKQVDSKDHMKKKRKNDEQFLERLEQVQLAEDLAAQREQYLVDKFDQQDMYKKSLDAQGAELHKLRYIDGLLRTPLLIRKPVTPFFDTNLCRSPHRLTPIKFPEKKMRFKPLPVPPREPDYEIFGKNDTTNEKMAEKRQRAYELFREQQDLVAQRKREAILKRLAEQKAEESVLDRTRRELLEDRASQFNRRFSTRKRLENDWCQAAECKRARDLEDRLRSLNPGLLLHDTVDKYKRCKQCLRKLPNCGESNIWRESRYIPGSRLMV